jgi:hypothetical protein
MNSRRTFVITAVSCGSALATGLMTGNALAQAKLDEKDAQARKSTLSMLTTKSAQTVLCSRVKQPMLLAVAHCLLANKLPAQVGAAHGLKKPNLSLI